MCDAGNRALTRSRSDGGDQNGSPTLAREMYAAGCFYGEIDKTLRRRAGSTKRQFEGVGYGSGQNRLVPSMLLVEREALTAARNRRTLTQDFCGDPPPGYSTLHGKTGLR
jgi:hypothetical protein